MLSSWLLGIITVTSHLSLLCCSVVITTIWFRIPKFPLKTSSHLRSWNVPGAFSACTLTTAKLLRTLLISEVRICYGLLAPSCRAKPSQNACIGHCRHPYNGTMVSCHKSAARSLPSRASRLFSSPFIGFCFRVYPTHTLSSIVNVELIITHVVPLSQPPSTEHAYSVRRQRSRKCTTVGTVCPLCTLIAVSWQASVCSLCLDLCERNDTARCLPFQRGGHPSSHVDVRLLVCYKERVLKQLRICGACVGVLNEAVD